MRSRVREIMEEQGVTVRGLAEGHSITLRTIMKARDDRHFRNCRIGTLEKIATALHCRVKDLFEEGGESEDHKQGYS